MPIRFVIFDVDDVLLNMDAAGALAERAVETYLATRLGPETARAAGERFARGYATLREELRRKSGEPAPELVTLREGIARWQRGVTSAGHPVKFWSRDTLLALALEAERVPVDAATVGGAVDHYWEVLANESLILPDVMPALEVLRSRGVTFHLATNSDGFLRFDDEAATFRYDPAFAVERKQQRLAILRHAGIGREDISIGDPIGKPDTAFYAEVFRAFGEKLGREVDPSATLAVGDSLSNDVLPPMALGAARGAWLVRAREEPGPVPLEQHEEVSVVRTLTEIEALL